MKKYLFILFALFIAAGCSNDSSNSNINPVTEPIKTTVLMYIVGTTYEQPDIANIFFETAYQENIKTDALGYGPANYMIKGMIENLNPENTNIFVQTGSADADMAWTDDEIKAAGADPAKFYIKDWYKASRWEINKNEGLKSLGSVGDVCLDTANQNCVDISDNQTIGDFLKYGVENYPADRYIVIFFSHGGGTIGGFGAGTSVTEMAKAFNNAKTATNTEFDIIGFAACLMGTAEWMDYLADYGKYYVASEESEYEFPWLLGDITQAIGQNQTTEQLLDTITSTYYTYSARNGAVPTNISAVDLKQVKALSGSLGELSKQISLDFDANPARTFNNLYVALSRSDSYGSSNLGLYDMQAFLNSLNETKWYGLDYSAYTKNVTDVISSSVKINKTSPFLSHSYGISFYAPSYAQVYDETLTPSVLAQAYAVISPNFSPEYMNMLKKITTYADTKTTSSFASQIVKTGTNVSIDYTSNFAPSYNSTLELIRKYTDGTVRIGTVAGNYDITTNYTEGLDNITYHISVDTGYENINDANLFAVAAYGTENYNPIRVMINKPIDSQDTLYATAATKFILDRNGQTYDLIALFGYTNNNGQLEVTGDASYQLVGSLVGELAPAFSFKAGDVIYIPDYSSEIVGKAANSLPTYKIECSSANCLTFGIVPFSAETAPEFRFNVQDIKSDTYYSQNQTIN